MSIHGKCLIVYLDDAYIFTNNSNIQNNVIFIVSLHNTLECGKFLFLQISGCPQQKD